MEDEGHSHKKNSTSELVKCDTTMQPMTAKWVFYVKTNENVL